MKEIKDTVLPTARGDVHRWLTHSKVDRQGVHEDLALGDPSRGHFDRQGLLVAGRADEGLEDVAFGHGGGGDDVHLHREVVGEGEAGFVVGGFGHGEERVHRGPGVMSPV